MLFRLPARPAEKYSCQLFPAARVIVQRKAKGAVMEQERAAVETSKKCTKAAGMRGIVIRLTPVLAAGSLFTAALIGFNDKGASANTPEQSTVPDVTVQIGPEILNALRETAFLEVLVMEASQRLERNMADYIAIVRLGSIHIEALYEFHVTAGVNLSRLTERHIQVERLGEITRVTVTIPWPVVTGIRCTGREYGVTESFLFRRSNELIHITLSDLDFQARTLVEDRCKRMGIVDQAADYARLEIESLLKRLGADVVVVRFE